MRGRRFARSPALVPLRGFCLVEYYTLMRAKNNRALTWKEVTLDPMARIGDEHRSLTTLASASLCGSDSGR
jgi:hypothetical protein